MIKKKQEKKKKERIVLMTGYSQLANRPVPNPSSVNKQQDLKVNDLLVTSSDALPLFFNGFRCVFFVWCWLLGVDVRTRVMLNFLMPMITCQKGQQPSVEPGSYIQRRQLSPAYLVIMVGFPITTLTIDARSVHQV